jgi:anthranilate synthase component 2
MKTLLIDNYDSFTYNLFQYVGELGGNPVVYRNDEITVDEIRALSFDRVIISPGPGNPTDPAYFGVCKATILEIGPTVPLLGVCLGLQGIVASFGGEVIRAPEIMHGKTSMVEHTEQGIFLGIPSPFEAMRYHSLIGKKETLPDCLTITATTVQDGLIMGVQHKEYPIHGIQFHPESIGTPDGKVILRNFLSNNKH